MPIGARLKELRKKKGFTLVQLSKKSGVQVATLSRIENEKMTGTLESHIAICQALEIDVTKLYSGFSSVDGGAEQNNISTQTQVHIHSQSTSLQILTTNALNKKMLPSLIQLESGGKTNKEKNALGTEKFIYIFEGKIEAQIGEEIYKLSEGHSLYFNAEMTHFFSNPNKQPARLLSIITPSSL